MMKKITLLCTSMLIITMLLIGCSGLVPAESQPTEQSNNIVLIQDDLVSASGKVVAKKYANLSFMVGAQEFSLFVKPGDSVKDGDRLAVLSDDALPQSIILAEAEILGARKALENLKQSDKARSTAELNKIQAEKALNKAQNELESIRSSKVSENSIRNVQAQLDIARDELADAEEAYNKVKDRAEGDVIKAQATLSLTNARKRVDDLNRQLSYYLGTADPIDIAEKEAAVGVAQAIYEDAVREVERLKDGADPNEIAVAEANIRSLEAVINQKYLIAPFDGTIIEVYAQSGEAVAPGVPVVLLTDLNTLVVQTTDLSEIDVAKVNIGDPVEVTFDALADVTINGSVSEIAFKNSTGSGVYYTVTIEMEDIPPQLRWGMSAFVEISIKKRP